MVEGSCYCILQKSFRVHGFSLKKETFVLPFLCVSSFGDAFFFFVSHPHEVVLLHKPYNLTMHLNNLFINCLISLFIEVESC